MSQLGAGGFFLDASFAAGTYRGHNGSIKDAGNFSFRTSLGVGIVLKTGNRVSITIDHLLNSNLKNSDPDTEAILLRYSRRS